MTREVKIPVPCFGCLNMECRNRSISAKDAPPLTRRALLRGIAKLAIPAAAFAAAYTACGMLFPASGDALRAAIGAAALFISAGIVYFLAGHP